MRGKTPWWLAAAVVMVTGSRASALVYNFEAYLDGLQETPPVVTPGTGYATMTLDDQTLQVVLSGTFADLIGTTNNAHIHGPAPAGTAAGVLFNITYDAGVTAGTFGHNGVITATQAQHLINEQGYINIHSTFRPGGEIRGQLMLIPEPASAALLIGAAGVLLRRNRSCNVGQHLPLVPSA